MSPTTRSSVPNVLGLTLACDLAAVRAAADRVLRFLSDHACAESDRRDCELALVEACNNAILYSQARPCPEIEIEVLCSVESIELRIKDHTPGFDWPRNVSLPDPESDKGRGLFLIQAVMNSARYERSREGNTLVLCKIRGKLPSDSQHRGC